LGTHAIGRVGELARDFFDQQLMIPTGAVAFDQVPSTIKRVGLGRIIANADRYIGMEGASRRRLVDKSTWRIADSRWSVLAAIDIRAPRDWEDAVIRSVLSNKNRLPKLRTGAAAEREEVAAPR
jgi:hypothetical protein